MSLSHARIFEEEYDDFQVPEGYLQLTEANDSRSTARFVIVIPTQPCQGLQKYILILIKEVNGTRRQQLLSGWTSIIIWLRGSVFQGGDDENDDHHDYEDCNNSNQ